MPAKNAKPIAASASKGKKQPSPVKPKVAATPATGASEKPKKRVLKQFSAEEKLGIYLRRILTDVHPATGISKDAMSTINSLALDLYKRIANEAAEMSKRGKGQALTAQDVQAGAKLSLPGELCAHAVSAGADAVIRFKASHLGAQK